MLEQDGPPYLEGYAQYWQRDVRTLAQERMGAVNTPTQYCSPLRPAWPLEAKAQKSRSQKYTRTTPRGIFAKLQPRKNNPTKLHTKLPHQITKPNKPTDPTPAPTSNPTVPQPQNLQLAPNQIQRSLGLRRQRLLRVVRE